MKIIKLSDVMKAIKEDKDASLDQRDFAGQMLDDIENYPGESFGRRAVFVGNTLSLALGLKRRSSVRRLREKTLELAKKYNIEPVEGSIDKEKKP